MEQGSRLRAQRSIDQCEYFRLPRIGGGDEMRFRHSPHELLQVAFSGGAHLSSGFGLIRRSKLPKANGEACGVVDCASSSGLALPPKPNSAAAPRTWRVCQARAYVAKLAEHAEAFEQPVGMEIVEIENFKVAGSSLPFPLPAASSKLSRSTCTGFRDEIGCLLPLALKSPSNRSRNERYWSCLRTVSVDGDFDFSEIEWGHEVLLAESCVLEVGRASTIG